MKPVVEVAPDSPKLLGSPDGSSGGRNTKTLGRDLWHTQVAGASVAKKDGSCKNNILVSPSWPKSPEHSLYLEGGPPCSVVNDAVLNDLGSPKRNSLSCKDLDLKSALEKSSKKVRNSGGGTKRPRVVQDGFSKCKPESGNANESSEHSFSPSTRCNISVKNQTLKKKHNLSCGRGDKRNTKVRCKNKTESSFLKNGLVSFSSSLGVNDFSGIYGQTPDVLDISKYAEELSIDELLKGGCSYPRVSEEKGKLTADSNAIVLQSVQKACSIFGAHKVLQLENCAELESGSVQDVSTTLPPHSSEVGQTDEATEDKGRTDHLSRGKVQDSVPEIKFSTGVYPPLHHPRDVMDRLVLPQPTVSDLLLSDRSKVTSSRNSSDPRSAKTASHQYGLPPFPWSHSFSGNNKLGPDALKLSACRAVCQGRWVSVNSSNVSRKRSDDLHVDFESLKFNQSLVPLVSSISEQSEDQIAATERCLSSSVANSSLLAHGDEFVVAHTLLRIAAQSMDGPSETLKFTRSPSHIAVKASKLKVSQRRSKVSDDSKPKARQSNPLKIIEDGFPLKKQRLSTDGRLREEPLGTRSTHQSSSSLIKSRHTKLLSTGRYVSDSNHVHKSFIKPRQITDWPDTSRHKFWRSAA